MAAGEDGASGEGSAAECASVAGTDDASCEFTKVAVSVGISEDEAESADVSGVAGSGYC